MTENIKQFLEADALRTQGEWFWESQGLLTMHEDGIHKVSVLTPNYEYESGCSIVSSEADDTFIAAASRIAPDIRQLLAAFEQVCGALEELTSVESDNSFGGLWSKTHYQTASGGERVYQAEITKSELVAFRHKLTAAAPWRKLMGGV